MVCERWNFEKMSHNKCVEVQKPRRYNDGEIDDVSER